MSDMRLRAPDLPTGRAGFDVVRHAGAAVAVVLHLAVGLIVAASGLVLPSGAVAAFTAAWLVGVALLVQWRRRPVAMTLVPVAIALAMVVVSVIGDAWLGWVA